MNVTFETKYGNKAGKDEWVTKGIEIITSIDVVI